MDLPGAVDTEVRPVGDLDVDDQLGVADRSRRRRPGLGGVVAARGDLHAGLVQHGADRLDPDLALIDHVVAMGVDVGTLPGGGAVELRREESRRRPQDVVGPTQLAVLPLQLGQPLRVARSWCPPGCRRRSRPAGPSCATSRGASRAGRPPERSRPAWSPGPASARRPSESPAHAARRRTSSVLP